MHINIKATKFNIPDNIREYIFKKMDKVSRLIKSLKLPQEAEIEVARTTEHHQKGDDIFLAEVNLKVGGILLRASAKEWDIKVAIDAMHKNLEAEIRKFKDKKAAGYKKGARKAKEIMREIL